MGTIEHQAKCNSARVQSRDFSLRLEMMTVTSHARVLSLFQSSAVEAACVILSVDETVRNPKSETDSGQQALRGPGAMRGRGMR